MTGTASLTGPRQAGELRDAMTDRLVADGAISSPAVEAAFRAVPRHLFVPPGTIETAAPYAAMLCDTSDGCGSTCSTTACNTASNDSF